MYYSDYRDEDQVLLLTCKECGTGTDTWRKISQVLPRRNERQVNDRYQVLMEKLNSWLQSNTSKQNGVEANSEGIAGNGEETDRDSL